MAQARELGIPLLSADNKILSYGHVRSLWSRPLPRSPEAAALSLQLIRGPIEQFFCCL